MKKSHVLSLVMLLGISTLGFAQDATPPAATPAAPNAPAGGRGGRGGGRNFDPAQMQQRMIAAIQEKLGATADEWKIISPLLQTVMEKERAKRELMGGRGGMRMGPQSEPAPEVAAVEKAVTSKDAAGIKSSLEALRKARTAKDADVTKAKTALREVLSVGQEAELVVMGILD